MKRPVRRHPHRFGYFPAIARLENSLKIMVYARDPTHGPHVHVAYEGDEKSATRLRIADGSVVDARSHLKAPDLRAARAWLAANREHAMAEWNRLNPPVARGSR